MSEATKVVELLADHPQADSSPWRRRFQKIYKDLQRKIVLLEYPPGVRLNVDDLADEHNVSRTPIRTVIQRLENEGLAVTRHGVGTSVAEISSDQFRDAMSLRMHLAELIGRLDSRVPSDGLAPEIERLADQFAVIDGENFEREYAWHDMQFHDLKLELIGNNLLRETYDAIYYRSVRNWFHHLPSLDWRTERDALHAHMMQTAKAVRRGDIAAVSFLTRNAISEGLYRLTIPTNAQSEE